MTSERWRRVDELFHATMGRDAMERADFLREACAGDNALRSEVEKLIAAHEKDGSFIDSPAYAATEFLIDDQAVLTAGQRLGHYEITSPIGRGGMGEVYLAEDTRLGRKVALKLLPSEFTGDEDRLRRFRQEARAASALNHPNILTIHEIGSENGTHFMATEYVEGDTLRRRMAGGALKLGEALDLAIQVASALAAAHQAGIVHRDIKPENIMVRSDGYAKVLDFGLAKLAERPTAAGGSAAPTLMKVETRPGIVMGTPHYMSPEQARGFGVDTRTDVFSLGVVIYEMVAGRAPFEGGTPSDVIVSLLDREPAPLSRDSLGVPAELERIVGKSLCKDREERYQVVKDLLIDLKSLREELAFEAKLERSVPPERRGGAASGGLAGPAVATGMVEAPHPTSNAEYFIAGVKRHKRYVALISVMLAVTAAASVFMFSHRAVALTDKDTILITDFVNTTGDPVFDGTLKQGLAAQLEQSPFLSIFPEARVRQTLRLMNRAPEERVTTDVAREACQRQGLKAYIAGAISSLGSNYVITLEAVNAQSGEEIAREQVEATNKEGVLKALSQAATGLREGLGESLQSIQKFDAPLEVTTFSLEALKAFSLGREQELAGKYLESIPFYKRAVELDPNFASAWIKLAIQHNNTSQPKLAAEYAEKAFELRDRASEYEKLRIAYFYYQFVTGELEKAIETQELFKRSYPREHTGPGNLAVLNARIGRFEKAIAETQEALRLNPNTYSWHMNLMGHFIRLNRFAEAEEVVGRAMGQKLDGIAFHTGLYQIAFVRGDATAMQQQLEWGKGRPDEYLVVDLQTETAAFAGQYRQSQDFSRRAVDMALRSNAKEVAAQIAAEQAQRSAALGLCQQAKAAAAQALALERSKASLVRGALALALCGEVGQAQSIIDELEKRYPKDTLITSLWLPTIRAVGHINRNDHATAIQLLEAAKSYEAVGEFWPQTFRGQAYLRGRNGAEAKSEFQNILDHRGYQSMSVLNPLAHLGLARAAAMTGDTAQARTAYQNFLALWKDADPDIPILQEAKQEYDKLKQTPK